MNKAQGPAGSQGSQLRDQLDALGLSLPMLGSDDDSADREYIKEFGLETYKALGKQWDCDFAERFFYIGAGGSFARGDFPKLPGFIIENAMKMDFYPWVPRIFD